MLFVEQQIDLVLHPKHYSAQPNPIDIACVEATRLSPEEGTHKRYFINTSSCGISGAVCNGANNSSKVLGGFATFLYQTCLRLYILTLNNNIRLKNIDLLMYLFFLFQKL